MTVDANDRLSGPYSGNGVTVAFAYDYRIEANTELRVILRDTDGVDTIKTLTTDYSVSGVGVDGGGNVTFVTAPASGEKVIIEGVKPKTQTVDYVNNERFPYVSHQSAIDKMVRIDQEQQRDLDRTLKFAHGETAYRLPLKPTSGQALLYRDSSGEIGQIDSTDYLALAGLADEIVGISAIAAEIEQVADIDAEIVIVADAMEDVETVADNITDVQAVAAALGDGSIPVTVPPLVVLVSGQSNTVYRPSYSWTVPVNLFRWNWDLDPTHVGTAFDAPASNVLGLADSVGNELAKRFPNRQIYIINIGRDNTPIANWLPAGSPDMYAAVKANIEAALAVIGVSKIDHAFWWQGETDSASSSTTYVSDFETLHARWRTETWWPYNTPVTLIGISELFSTANAQFNKNYKQLVSREPDTRAYVHSAIMPDAFWDDYLGNIHANGAGYAAIGRMAAEAAYGPKNGGVQHFFTDPYTASGLLWKDQSGNTQLGVRNDSTNSAAVASLAITGSAGQLNFNTYSAAAPLFANSMVEFWTGSGPRFFSALDASGSYEFFTNTARRVVINNSGLAVSGALTASAAGNAARFTNSTDNASVQALIIEGDRATPATSDIVYASFQLSDSAGAQQEFARISAVGSNVNSGAYAGYLLFSVSNGGTRSDELRLTNTSLSPHVSGGSALGTTTLMWNGAFLASGTAINWNNGDVTITHSSNALAFAGASSGYSFDATVAMATGFTVGDANFAALLFGGSPLITLDSGSDALGYVRADNKLQLIVASTEVWSATPTSMYAAGSIELGHATDTTLARVAAGRASIEGKEIALLSATQPFTAAQSVSVAGLPLRLTNTTDSAAVQALIIEGDRATPNGGDTVYASLLMSNSSGSQVEWGRITARISTSTAGSETGQLRFGVVSGGSFSDRIQLSQTSIVPITNDTVALGTTTLNWSDLFLASGGVINWNNGDVTITHSANALAFAGASSGYTFDAPVSVSGKAVATVPTVWTAWTPTISAASGTITTVGTVTARYTQIHKTVFFTIDISITTNGTGAGSLNFTLPVAPTGIVVCSGNTFLSNIAVQGATGTSTMSVTTAAGAYPTSAGGRVFLSGHYEVA